MISADGNWLAEECDVVSSELSVVNMAGSFRKTITFRDIFGDEYPSGNAYRVFPLHWSNDLHTLYFSTNITGWESLPTVVSFYYDGSLYKLDLQSGNWAEVIHANQLDRYFYSFSPTDRRVAYPSYSYPDSSLNIFDLKTGEQYSLFLQGFSEWGAVAWAPDGLSFAFTAAKWEEIGNFIDQKYTLYIFSVENQNLTAIISNTSEKRIPSLWSADDILVIDQWDENTFNDILPGQTQYYDINARSFIIPTTTPSP